MPRRPGVIPNRPRATGPQLEGKKVIGYVRKDPNLPALEDQQVRIEEWAHDTGVELIDLVIEPHDSDTPGQTLSERHGLLRAINLLGIHRAELLVVSRAGAITTEPVFAAVVRALVTTRSSAQILPLDGERLALGEEDQAATVAIGRYLDGLGKLDFAMQSTEIPGDEEVRMLAQNLRGKGLSFREIADVLDERGYKTRSGLKWHWNQVSDLCKIKTEAEVERAEAAKKERLGQGRVTPDLAAQMLAEEEEEEDRVFGLTAG